MQNTNVSELLLRSCNCNAYNDFVFTSEKVADDALLQYTATVVLQFNELFLMHDKISKEDIIQF
jgi:hypothetical protein